MKEKFLQLVRAETGVADATLDTRIDALGIDSLDFQELLLTIREQLGPIPTKRAVDANTLGDLYAAVGA
jgi:acyl carrier protein